jgi:hypothetical protein
MKERTVEVGMADVHEVDALAREAGGDLLPFLFDVEHDRHEPFDVGRRNVVLVRTLNKWFALQIYDFQCLV